MSHLVTRGCWHGRTQDDLGARRARAQPQERRCGHPARPARGVHRAVGLGQVVARVRHDLCRGAAPLCRIALGLCAAIPRHDGKAGHGPYQRPVPGDFHRAEDDLQEPALDRRHGDRDLRLHAAALCPRRHALFPGHRAADRGAAGAGHGRPRHGDGGGHARLSARPHRARPQGRVPQGIPRAAQAGLSAGQGRWRVSRSRRAAQSGQEIPPRYRRRGRPHRDQGGAGDAARRQFPHRARSGAGHRGAGDRAARRQSRSGSPSRKISPVPSAASPSPRSSRGCFPSTRPSAPAPIAAVSGSSCSSTKS